MLLRSEKLREFECLISSEQMHHDADVGEVDQPERLVKSEPDEHASWFPNEATAKDRCRRAVVTITPTTVAISSSLCSLQEIAGCPEEQKSDRIVTLISKLRNEKGLTQWKEKLETWISIKTNEYEYANAIFPSA